MSPFDYEHFLAAVERILGPTPERAPVHPEQQEADDRRIERAERDAWFDGYASDAEMDGAAADYMYAREPAGDWRNP